MQGQVSKWGNGQGVRLPKSLLEAVGIAVNDRVEIVERGKEIVIVPVSKRDKLDYLLEGYDAESDRYEWGGDGVPAGRELL